MILTVIAIASPMAAQGHITGPVARVENRIDDGDRTVLRGHVPPQLQAAVDAGRLPAGTQMSHLLMVLKPTVEQDHALRTLLDQQLDKSSANYHKWLTPDQFGAQFGVADSDIAQVTGWLTQNGFTVEQVARSKRFIEFSGTAQQVETAFQTEMHSYNVNGAMHVSNNSDISVPSALQPVIAAVPTLNNFFKTSDFQKAGTVAEEKEEASRPHLTVTPDSTNPFLGKFYFLDPFQGVFNGPAYTNGATHFVGAGDFATIYNTAPLIAGGFDGTGVSIGIIGRTDIHMADVQIYRYMFGLKPNDPTFIIAGEDPGVVGGDDGESYLDVEVSGGAAPGAAVKFVTSRASLTTDGVDLSAMYAVQNNLTDIISESYGQCEANFPASAISFYTNLWGQAAAQGQTVFLSSGDNGPAGCDASTNTFSNFGYAVSGLASTAFNVAVGGTIFADTAANWNATATTAPPFSSALGYIPEKPWNEAKASGATGASGLWSGSGGISAYVTTPPWQRGFGVPLSDPPYPNKPTFSDPASPFVPGPHRYMPDVAMAAAAQHDGTLYCAEGICQLNTAQALVNAGIVGGTSVAAPTMAGVQALINHVNGGRQGMANYVYYALADAQHTAGLVCDASSASLDPNCAFRDITLGNTLVCTDSLTSTTCTTALKIGWTAAAGYDFASGLGSPNAQKLANLWNTVTFRSSLTTMNATPTTGLTHGQSVTVSGSVAPGSGSGVPTGHVAFIPSSGMLGDPMNPNTGAFQNPVPVATLDGSGNYAMPVTNLPAGTYTFVARYGGDGTFAASTSLPVTVTISAESTAVTIAPNAFNGTTCVETPATTFTYGSYIWTDLIVTGASGQGAPTGTVSVTDNGNPLVTTTLNANGAGHMLSGLIPATSCVFGYTFQDTPSFPVGSHTIGATYSGDSSFNSVAATPVTITITQATTTGALATGSTNIASGNPVQLTFTVAGLAAASPGTLTPTGTVTFTDTTTSTTLGTATLTPTATFGGRAILTTSLITTAGANSITASWPGDANYNAITSSAVTVTVQGGTATSVVVTSNTQPSVLGGRPTWTATMTPTTVTSGTANFFDGGVLLGTGAVGAAHTATFRPAAAVNLPAGVHNITAIYAGTATFNSSISPIFAQTFNPAVTTTSLTVRINGSWGLSWVLEATLGTTQAATPVSGTVQFSDGGNPIGGPQPFTTVASASGGFGLWQGTLPVSFPAGTHVLTAQLTDPNYTSAVSNTQTVVVSMATPKMVSTGGTFTYNGAPHGGSGSATGGAGESLTTTVTYTGTGATTYGPTSTPPTNAGTYSVVVHTPGDANNAPTDSSPAALTINPATPIVTATGGTFTYDGTPHAGSGSATGGAGESLTATLTYNGTGTTTYGPTSTAPTAAGTYQVQTHTPGDGNNTSGDSLAVALTINKATSVVSASGGTFTYNGSPQGGTNSATGGAGESLSMTVTYTGTGATTYGPSATAPTGAGTYSVSVQTTGDANNTAGSATASVTINKFNTLMAAFGGTVTYTGNPHAGSGQAIGGAGESLPVTLSYQGISGTTYGPSATPPTNFGVYLVTAHTVGDANNNAEDSLPNALRINKATATIVVTAYCAHFDSSAHTAAGTATGVLSESLPGLVLTSTTHTAAGTYLGDAWSFTDPNYSDASGTVDDSIVDAAITAPPLATAGLTGNTASVVNAGTGAAYAWGITGGLITAGAGTNSITFTAGGTGTLTLNVTVTTTTACSDTKSANVIVLPLVTITSVSPANGTVTGDTLVTINGSGFAAGATVTFGGTPATSVVVASAIKITARTPAHAIGSVNVTVTNTDTSNATLTSGYLYQGQVFDPNNDNTITSADIFYLVNYLFLGGPAPHGASGVLSGDANGDGKVDSADIFYIVNYLFLGGQKPNTPRSTPGVVSGLATAEAIGGSITLGTPVLRDGHTIVPVIMTTNGNSIVPQSMALRAHFDVQGAMGDVTVRKAGAAGNAGVAFELNRQTGNDVTYLVSYDPRNGGLALGSSHSAVVAEIEIASVSGNVAISIDPALTMLSDQSGTITATVGNGRLQVQGTTIGSGPSPRPRTPGNEVN